MQSNQIANVQRDLTAGLPLHHPTRHEYGDLPYYLGQMEGGNSQTMTIPKKGGQSIENDQDNVNSSFPQWLE